jgi:hypothetical protein
MAEYNPFNFWKKNLTPEKYNDVRKGIILFQQTIRNTDFDYQDYIDTTLINNKSPDLTQQMIYAPNPIDFVIEKKDEDWDWIGVGFFTCLEFQKRMSKRNLRS